ncbi:MAG: sigma 54-interacting transcriptional regulator [Bacteroidia bacterium]
MLKSSSRSNCASLSNDLFESRLLPSQVGAFTRRRRRPPGAFEDADGGWLFLDEVGDMSDYMQQALLRVLQERKSATRGRNKRAPGQRADCSSHQPATCGANEAGRFRWDLHYRLAATELVLPAPPTGRPKTKMH